MRCWAEECEQLAATLTSYPCSTASLTPRQESDKAVGDAIKKAESDMLTEGRHGPAASGADAGAYGKELAKRVQTDLEGKTVGGGTFMFNTGVNLTTKKVDKLNVTQGTKDFADVDIMWLEDGKKLNVGDTVNPAKVLAYEMKTSELRDADAAAGPRREGSTSRSLARERTAG